jgi:hypothetical protein
MIYAIAIVGKIAHSFNFKAGHSSFTGLRFFALFLILNVVVVGWVKRL